MEYGADMRGEGGTGAADGDSSMLLGVGVMEDEGSRSPAPSPRRHIKRPRPVLGAWLGCDYRL